MLKVDPGGGLGKAKFILEEQRFLRRPQPLYKEPFDSIMYVRATKKDWENLSPYAPWMSSFMLNW